MDWGRGEPDSTTHTDLPICIHQQTHKPHTPRKTPTNHSTLLHHTTLHPITSGLFANDLAIGGPSPPKSPEEYEAASEKGNIAGLVWRVDYDKEKGCVSMRVCRVTLASRALMP